MSPVRAILLHSPGRKPWVNCFHTFLNSVGAALYQRMQSHEPQRRKTNARSVSAAPKGAHFTFICRYPGLHFGLCRSVVPKGIRKAERFSCSEFWKPYNGLFLMKLPCVAFRMTWSSLLQITTFVKKVNRIAQ